MLRTTWVPFNGCKPATEGMIVCAFVTAWLRQDVCNDGTLEILSPPSPTWMGSTLRSQLKHLPRGSSTTIPEESLGCAKFEFDFEHHDLGKSVERVGLTAVTSKHQSSLNATLHGVQSRTSHRLSTGCSEGLGLVHSPFGTRFRSNTCLMTSKHGVAGEGETEEEEPNHTQTAARGHAAFVLPPTGRIVGNNRSNAARVA